MRNQRPEDIERTARSIRQSLGRGPQGIAPQIPDVEPRLRIDEDGNIVDDIETAVEVGRPDRRFESALLVLVEKVVERVLDRFRSEVADLVDMTRNGHTAPLIPCVVCSHDDCKHFHDPDDMNSQDVSDYLDVEISTIYSWLHRQKITRPLSENPHLWDAHVIACHKHDQKLVFPKAQYDPALHRELLTKNRAEREKKRKSMSAKRSAHMLRENARRRVDKTKSCRTQKPKPTTKSTQTRTSRATKR